jgi:hypothetical protein
MEPYRGALAGCKSGIGPKFPGPVSRRSGTSAGGTDGRQKRRKGRVLDLRHGQSWDFKDVVPTAWPWGRAGVNGKALHAGTLPPGLMAAYEAPLGPPEPKLAAYRPEGLRPCIGEH